MDQAEEFQQLLRELSAAPSAEALVETLRKVGDAFGTGKVNLDEKNSKIWGTYLTHSFSSRCIEDEYRGRCNKRCHAIVCENRRSLGAKRVLPCCEWLCECWYASSCFGSLTRLLT